MASARFDSLRDSNYRRFFGGYIVSETGDAMQRIGQIWLFLSLTGSPVLLGVLAALQHLPMLVLAPWGGLVADRIDRRRILVITSAAGALLVLALGALTAAGAVNIPLLYVFALLLGATKAVDHPAKQAIVYQIVGPERLANALTLSSVSFNLARVAGPAAAGVVISSWGVAVGFYVNALSYLAVVVALRSLDMSTVRAAHPAGRGRRQLRAGIAYVRRTPSLLGPMVVMTVAGIFAYEWSVTIPLLATTGFAGDAETVGTMFSVMALGAVTGGLLLAGVLKGTDRFLLACGSAFSVAMVSVAASPSLALVLAALFFLGATSAMFRATASSMLALRAAPEMRGRVMGLLSVALMGTTPLGGPLVGWLAGTIGIRQTMVLAAVITGAATWLAWTYVQRAARRAGELVPAREPG